eukprot:NODE_438_length_8605_cov_0.277334.p2 type:complete len:117 gc:universal NODE_438_length_8605_cov_0.277334:5443-5793(+)
MRFRTIGPCFIIFFLKSILQVTASCSMIGFNQRRRLIFHLFYVQTMMEYGQLTTARKGITVIFHWQQSTAMLYMMIILRIMIPSLILSQMHAMVGFLPTKWILPKLALSRNRVVLN